MEETNNELVKKLRDEIKFQKAEITWYQRKMIEYKTKCEESGVSKDQESETEFYRTLCIKYKKNADFNASPEFRDFLLFTKIMITIVILMMIFMLKF